MAEKRPLYLFCDNFKQCEYAIPFQDTRHNTEERARARGWHVFHGTTFGGLELNVILCPRCVGKHRRPERDDTVDGGEQLELEF